MKIKTKQQVQVEQEFLYNFARVLETFPQYTISQHIVHFTRRLGVKQELYEWNDEFLLQRLEANNDELTNTLINHSHNANE